VFVELHLLNNVVISLEGVYTIKCIWNCISCGPSSCW